MKAVVLLMGCALAAGTALAKLPPPPPVDPVKAEAVKQKAIEDGKAAALLQAKYEDKAVASYAAKAKAEGKTFKPMLGPGVPPPPAPAAAVAAAKPATPAAPTPAPAALAAKK